MICQCGARIPDNVEYCPYCGKRQFIRTRPAQLTNNKVEPFVENRLTRLSKKGKR